MKQALEWPLKVPEFLIQNPPRGPAPLPRPSGNRDECASAKARRSMVQHLEMLREKDMSSLAGQHKSASSAGSIRPPPPSIARKAAQEGAIGPDTQTVPAIFPVPNGANGKPATKAPPLSLQNRSRETLQMCAQTPVQQSVASIPLLSPLPHIPQRPAHQFPIPSLLPQPPPRSMRRRQTASGISPEISDMTRPSPLPLLGGVEPAQISAAQPAQQIPDTNPAQQISETQLAHQIPDTNPAPQISDTRSAQQISDSQPTQQISDGRLTSQLSDSQPTFQISDSQPAQQISDTLPAQQIPDAQSVQNMLDTRPAQQIPDTQSVQNMSDTRPAQHIPDAQSVQNMVDTRPAQQIPYTQCVQNMSDTRPAQQIPYTQCVQNMSDTRPAQHIPDAQSVQNMSDAQPTHQLSDRQPTQQISDTLHTASAAQLCAPVPQNSFRPRGPPPKRLLPSSQDATAPAVVTTANPPPLPPPPPPDPAPRASHSRWRPSQDSEDSFSTPNYEVLSPGARLARRQGPMRQNRTNCNPTQVSQSSMNVASLQSVATRYCNVSKASSDALDTSLEPPGSLPNATPIEASPVNTPAIGVSNPQSPSSISDKRPWSSRVAAHFEELDGKKRSQNIMTSFSLRTTLTG